MINKYFGIKRYGNVTADLAKVKKKQNTRQQMNAADTTRFGAVWTSSLGPIRQDDLPWVRQRRWGREQLAAARAHLAASLRGVAHLIQPFFMMNTSNAIMEQLGRLDSILKTTLAGFPENVTYYKNSNLP